MIYFTTAIQLSLYACNAKEKHPPTEPRAPTTCATFALRKKLFRPWRVAPWS